MAVDTDRASRLFDTRVDNYVFEFERVVAILAGGNWVGCHKNHEVLENGWVNILDPSGKRDDFDGTIDSRCVTF